MGVEVTVVMQWGGVGGALLAFILVRVRAVAFMAAVGESIQSGLS